MNPIFEWMLMVHRVVWFPLNWAIGLESAGVELPVEFAPALAGATSLPEMSVAKGGHRVRVAAK